MRPLMRCHRCPLRFFPRLCNATRTMGAHFARRQSVPVSLGSSGKHRGGQRTRLDVSSTQTCYSLQTVAVLTAEHKMLYNKLLMCEGLPKLIWQIEAHCQFSFSKNQWSTEEKLLILDDTDAKQPESTQRQPKGFTGLTLPTPMAEPECWAQACGDGCTTLVYMFFF
jgi:hypothetical protein